MEVDDAGNTVNSSYFAHKKIEIGQNTTPAHGTSKSTT